MKQQSKVHLYYLAILLLFVFSGFFIPPSWYDYVYFELYFSQIGLILLPTVLFLVLAGPARRDYLPLNRLSLREFLYMPFLVAPLIFIGSFLNSFLVFLVSSLRGPVYAPLFSVDTSLPVLPYVLGMAILPGILEELVHRGILLNTYRDRGNRFAMVTSALLFALLHLSVANLANTFMLGIFFAWLVLSGGSLLSSMYAHFLYNLFILIAEYQVVMEDLPEYLSISFPELVSLIPATAMAAAVWLLVFRLYKKGHPKVTLEPRRTALRSFFTMLRTDRLFALCLLFILLVNGFLLTL